MSTRRSSPSVRPATRWLGLDSLRGLAVVIVVAYHLGHLRGGFLGVDVFFVLSGYLVTALALREIDRTGTLAVRAFWGRRVRRLGPALFAMVPVVLAVALWSGWDRTNLGTVTWDAIATLTWWGNWRQVLGDVGGYWASSPSLFRHAWSLAIEEQFYLTWPLAITAALWWSRRRDAAVAERIAVLAASIATLSAVWSVVLAHRLPVADLSRVYVGTDTRMVGPLTGCALAAVQHRHPLPESGVRLTAVRVAGALAAGTLTVLAVTVDVSAPSLYRTGLLPAVSLLAAVALAAARTLHSTDPVTIWLGRRSYAIYLWSWPIQVLVEQRWSQQERWAVTAIVVVLSLMLAELSWRLIEHPWIRLTAWAIRARPRRLVASASVVTAAAAVMLIAVAAEPVPAHRRIDTDESLEEALRKPPPTAPSTQGNVTETDPAERVMVLGDSTAFAIGFYAPDDLPEGIASVDNRAVNGCSVLAPLGYGHPQLRTGEPFIVGAEPFITVPQCAGIDEAIDIGLAGEPTVVVLDFGSWEVGPVQAPDGRRLDARSPEVTAAIRTRLFEIMERTDMAGARTVLAPVACPGPDPSFDFLRVGDPLPWVATLAGDVLQAGIDAGFDVAIMPTPPTACVDGDPLGEATDAKNRAMDDEIHVLDADGGAWVWNDWWGPGIAATRPDR